MASSTSSVFQQEQQVTSWRELAQQILAGHQLTYDEGVQVLESNDTDVLELLNAAYVLRKTHFGNKVQLYFLMNAKSGLCPEDCAYCSQSKISNASIPKYNLLNREQLLKGAHEAAQRQAKTYCIVISARSPSQKELDAVNSVVSEIKEQYDLKICACLGLLSPDQAQQLKEAGVDRVNHNLNTSGEFYEQICSTHTFQERVDTLKAVKQAGMEMCSGGIVGMGETKGDIVNMALQLRDLGVHSIPVNFLNPIDGTPLEGIRQLDPRYCLKILALFRLANPDREIRVAGGREMHLRSLQPLALYAANSLFVGDYLTTKGQLPDKDYQMITDLGFEIQQTDA
ncbi:MAG: biotin synthase BioB [Pirellulaceae bacterium]|nr:biotin synthase BioB [Pirellulaceae bacterium]